MVALLSRKTLAGLASDGSGNGTQLSGWRGLAATGFRVRLPARAMIRSAWYRCQCRPPRLSRRAAKPVSYAPAEVSRQQMRQSRAPAPEGPNPRLGVPVNAPPNAGRP